MQTHLSYGHYLGTGAAGAGVVSAGAKEASEEDHEEDG